MSGRLLEVDTQELFIWLREPAAKFGFDLVRDVGDFCAHRYGRDKGVSWHRGNDFCDCMLSLHAQLNNQPVLEPFKIGLRARARLIPEEALELMGFRRVPFLKLCGGAIDKVTEYNEEVAILSPQASEEERRIVTFLLKTPRAPLPIIQPNFLWETFNLMCETKLISRDCISDFEKVSEYITVFAMTRMHLTKINKANLNCFLMMGTSSKMINRLIVRVFVDDHKQFKNLTTVFMSTCDVREWCSPALQPAFVQPGLLSIPNWGTAVDFSTGTVCPFDLENFKQGRPALKPAEPEPDIVFLPKADLNGPKPQ